jgi:hypothetical protein
LSRGPLLGLAIGVVAGALAAGFLAPAAPLAEPLVDGDPEARATTLPTVPVRPPPGSDDVLLAWTPGRLPKGIDTAVGALPGVTGVASVSLDLLSVTETVSAKGAEVDTAPSGLVYPLEAIALSPLEYRRFLPETERTLLEGLRRGGAWLGTTSAAIRRLGPGGLLRLPDGDELTVTAVVPDDVIGAAEVVISQTKGRSLGVVTPRYLLISYEGDRLAVEAAVRSAFGGLPVRLRAPGETPFLRYGDAVLPQSLIKAQFGEFAYRMLDDRSFEPDPGWVAENIVTTELPLLGQVTCHRTVVPLVHNAMAELKKRDLDSLVDPEEFAGCWNPRLIAAGRGISRHAWGAALDINWDGNPTGIGSDQDPRLVDAMVKQGFTWGGPWLIPDPAHFEWVGGAP